MDIARIKHFLASMGLLLLAGLAQAGNLAFNGGAVASCTRSGTNYSCTALALGSSDSVIISSGYAVTVTGGSVIFGANQGLTMSGSAALTANGSLSIDSIKSGNLHVSGGSLAAANGDFSMGGQGIVANISATGQIALGNGTTVDGNLLAPAVELAAAHVQVNGNVTASDTLFVGANDAISGNVVAGTVTLHAASAYIGGNARVDWITLENKGRVAGTITCNGGTAGAPCNCVTNNSHYDIDTPEGPHCAAPPSPPPPSGPDHILISHAGTALTCQPQTVTLTACANAACTAPHYSGLPSVTVTPGGQSFALGASGVSSATVRRLTAGTATLAAVSNPAAQNPATCYNSAAPGSSTPCSMQFNDSGLDLSIPNHVADSPASFSVSAKQAAANNQSCVPLFANTTKSINFTCTYANPAAGTVTLRVGDQAATVPALSGACGTAGSPASLSFDNGGKAVAWMKYADVGQIGVGASYAPSAGSDAGLVVSGATSVVVAPASFSFDRIWDGGTPGVNNPQLQDGTIQDVAFVKAGVAFAATVSARNASGGMTGNFGMETPKQTVTLTQALLLPAAGSAGASAGTLSGGITLSAGTGSSANLAWSEVGVIRLAATLGNQYGYLGAAGAETRDAGNALLSAAGGANVGRFIPDHFDTFVLPGAPTPAYPGTPMTPGVPMGCSASLLSCAGSQNGFAYASQGFGLHLKALNANGSVTANYAGASVGSLVQGVKLTGWLAKGGAAQSAAGDPRYASATGQAVDPLSFILGESKTIQTYVYPGIPTLPGNVFFRVVDRDGVSSLRGAASVEDGLTVVSGRMLIPNNYGSELLPMTIKLRAQLWSAGAAWVTNLADGPPGGAAGSAVTPGALAFSGCKKNLLDSSRASSCKAALMVAGPAGTVLHFGQGQAEFRLLAPGAGNNGSAYLQFLAPANPSSAFLPSAPAQATFGIYKAGPVIYVRELY